MALSNVETWCHFPPLLGARDRRRGSGPPKSGPAPPLAGRVHFLFRLPLLLPLLTMFAVFYTCSSTEEGDPLPEELSAVYAEVEACTQLTASPPTIRWSKCMPCPTSQKPCCIESMGIFPCPWGGMCGAAGMYDLGTRTITLPEGCTDAFRHECIHHLLACNERDCSEGDPAFACQGPLDAGAACVTQ